MKIALLSIYPDIQSYGLRSLSACLKQEGHDVDLIFIPKVYTERYEEQTLDDLVKLTKESDLVGITLMSNFWDNAIQITQKLKDNYDYPIVWGGTHPTVRPEECLDYADMVCVGEGEETLMELTRKMQNKQYYYDTKGMGFNNKGKKIINKIRELPGTKNATIKSLDQIPFQDIDYESHFILKGKNVVKMDMAMMESWGVFYMTQPTRGCPYKCTFCVNNTFHAMYPHQKPIRKRSIDYLIRELQEVKRKLPWTKLILFDDDAFFLMSVEEMEDFGKQYKKYIRLPLCITGATPITLTKEKLALLVDAGLVELRMGIQSAGSTTKKLYTRPHSNQQVENAVRMINKYKDKVRVRYDIILDDPWAPQEDTIETLMFLSKLPTPFLISLFSLILFPGTDLYNKAKKEGMIGNDDINDIYRKHYWGTKKTYLNSLFYLLNEYTLIGIGISPIIMFLLTNKTFRQLHLNKLLFKIVQLSFPFFRYLGRSTKPSTRLYRINQIIEFNEGETTYRSNAIDDPNTTFNAAPAKS